jgi:alpha-glucosidase
MTFTLGRSLLIAGPPKPESPAQFDICLPKGGWYDYWTGLPVTAAKLKETPKLDTLPVFVRAGTILPRQPVVQSTAETPRGALRLDVYPGDDCRGEIYADDGTSIGGPSLRQDIRCSMSAQGLMLQFEARAGTYRPWWSELAVTIHGWSGGSASVSEGTPVLVDARAGTASFTIPDQRGPRTILLRKE